MTVEPKSSQPTPYSLSPARKNGSRGRLHALESVLIGILGLSLPLANFPFFSWRGFGIDLSHLVGGLFLIIAAGSTLLRLRALPPIRLLIPSIALLLVAFLPYAFHRLPGFSVPQFWKTLLHLAFLIGVFLAVASSRLSGARFGRILALLACEALLLSLYGIWQSVAFSRGWPTGIGLLNRFAAHELRGEAARGWRATATFEEPKWLAIYLLPGLCYSYGLAIRALRAGRDRVRDWWILAFVLIAAGIVVTVSLGEIPVMGILAAAAFIHLVRSLRRKGEKIGALAGLAVIVLFAAWSLWSRSNFSELFRVRVADELAARSAADPRLAPSWAYRENLRYSWLVFRESPWFGIGVGQFAPVGRVRGRQIGIPPELTKDGPWIGLGGLLAELGLAGLAAFALLVLMILVPARRGARSAENSYRAMASLLVAAVILKETNAGFYVHFWTWFPLGVAALGARTGDNA